MANTTALRRLNHLRSVLKPCKLIPVSCKAMHSYTIEERGRLNTPSYRIYFKDNNGHYISPFHDIPLFANQEKKIYNMVVEIPRWTNQKMEIATKEKLNPIKQDLSKGEPRFAPNIFPYKGYIWNYGALPQTWEYPKHIDEASNCKGDNDPLDICEIGSKVFKRGEVIQVKILGILGMIDQGEMDWKVIALNTEDELFGIIDSIEDLEQLKLGYLSATREWFRTYKLPNNKPPNNFSFEGKYQTREFADRIINEAHLFWKKMVNNECEHDLAIENRKLLNNSSTITDKEAAKIVDETDHYLPPAEIDQVHKSWHFIN